MFCTVDALGNRLGLERAERTSRLADVAREAVRREAGSLDASDGIAAYSLGRAGLDFAFCNPDGSPELLCGNALLALAALTRPVGSLRTSIRTPLAKSIEIGCADDRLTLDVAVDTHTAISAISTGLGNGVVIDIGTPHVVIESDAIGTMTLADARTQADALGMNLTLYALREGTVQARTIERGMKHETESCGSGALSIGLVVSGGRDGRWIIAFRGGLYLFERTADGTRARISVAASSVRTTSR